jgi:spermidine synthase
LNQVKNMSPPTAAYPGIVTAVLAAFFISGACGLIHETAWTRLLRHIMGNTTFSITTVLCAFMGGLALGSYLGGRFIDQRQDHMRVFAILEGGIGVYCLLLPWLIHFVEPVYAFIYQNTHTSFYAFGLLRFFFSGLILLVPATCMGATLPILSKFLTRSTGLIGKSVGTLYAVNTFGAVLGAFASGFLLIPNLGVNGTIYLASFFNLLVGAVGFWLYRHTKTWIVESPLPSIQETAVVHKKDKKKKHKKKSKKKEPQIPRPEPLSYARKIRLGMLWGYGLSGFAALVYEIAWARVLSLLIGSTVYAFSLMLTAFVLGIASGSILFSRVVDRLKHPMRTLALIQALMGLSALLVVPFMDRLPYFATGMISRLIESFWMLQFAEFSLILGIMLVPTLLMGAAFPLVTRIFNQDSTETGRTVGAVYGSNTIGNILGSFVGGFLLIPFIGIQNSIFVAVGANIIVSCIFLGFTRGVKPVLKMGFTAALVVVTTLGIVAIPTWDPGRMSFGPFHEASRISLNTATSRSALEKMAARSKILFHKEGLTTTVTVKEVAKGVRALYINGKPDASSLSDLPSQELVAHIPLMFHASPKDALVIGLASGISLGSAGLHPLEKIDCVEISPAMVEASRFFDEDNYRIMEDPRVNIIIADGRNHLLLGDQSYDVIISQPSNPYFAGVADLFTKEFFELCKQRLNQQGIMCTWVQSYNIDLATFQSITKTFSAVFPNMTFWRAGKSDCLLVGSMDPLVMDYDRLKLKLVQQGIRNDLERIAVRTVPEFLSHLLMAKEGVQQFSQEGLIHTDNNSLVEFSAPRALTRTGFQWPLIAALEKSRDPDLSFLQTMQTDPESQADLNLTKATSINFIRARGHVFQYHILRNKNQTAMADQEISKAVALNPGDNMLKELNAKGHREAFYLARSGKDRQAMAMYQQMIARIPGDEKAHFNLGLLMKKQGNFRTALEHFRQAVLYKPTYYTALYNVGEISGQLGDFDGAFTAYEQALDINSELIPALAGLSRLLSIGPDHSRRDPERALGMAEKANRLTNNQDPYLLETLSLAYHAAGRPKMALATTERALGFARKSGDHLFVKRLERLMADQTK